MAIYAPVEKKSQREIPDEGSVAGICVGVWDLGFRDDEWQGQPKVTHDIMFTWEVDQRMTGEGEYKDKRHVLSSRKFALTFGDKANLTLFVKTLTGKTLTEEERKTFDLESIKGMCGAVTIAHTIKDGITYANLQTITPLMKGVEPIVAETDWSTPPEWIAKLIEAGHTIKEGDSEACKQRKTMLAVVPELKVSIVTPEKSANAKDNTFITKPQIRLMFAMLKENGIEQSALKEYLEKFFGIDSSTKITKPIFDCVIKWINDNPIEGEVLPF